MSHQNIDLDDLARPESFAKRYPDIVGSSSRLRYLLRHRESNGMKSSGAVVQRGRQLFIVKQQFLDWILANR